MLLKQGQVFFLEIGRLITCFPGEFDPPMKSPHLSVRASNILLVAAA